MEIEIYELIFQAYNLFKQINPELENVCVHFEKDSMEIEFSNCDKTEAKITLYKKNWTDYVYAKLKKDVFTRQGELGIREHCVDSDYPLVYVPNTIICDIEQAVSKITKEEVLTMLDKVEDEFLNKKIAATNDFFDIALGTKDVKKNRG